MKVGPKFKIGKRLGPSVFEKCQTQKFQLSQARSEKSGRRKGMARSDYGKQFLEKQRVRYTYGISEKQFKNYVDMSQSGDTKNPMEALFQALEMRLDNVVYRLSLSPTRRGARQMVSHGHITINDIKVTVPSIRVKIGDIIGIRKGSQTSKLFANLEEKLKDISIPNWLNYELDKKKGTVKEKPVYRKTDHAFDLTPVLEFYSR